MLNVVIINGGRGAGTIIPTILENSDLRLTSIVNAYDDGKSTGRVRNYFKMLGPSDIRKVQELMLPTESKDYNDIKKLFNYRYAEEVNYEKIIKNLQEFSAKNTDQIVGITLHNTKMINDLRVFVKSFLEWLFYQEIVTRNKFDFSDCAIMNCIYAGAYIKLDRDLEKTTKYINQLFKLKGNVILNSNDNKYLVAQRENGEILSSEAEIVETRSNVLIDRIYLLNNPLNNDNFDKLRTDQKKQYLNLMQTPTSVSHSAILAIKEADLIIYAPGTQHSSLYPTYMSSGLAKEISNNKSAFKVFISNIGADYETPEYRASDYVYGAFKYLTNGVQNYKIENFFNCILVNKPQTILPERDYVIHDEDKLAKIPVKQLVDDWESKDRVGKHDGDKVVSTIIHEFDLFTKINND